MRKKLSTSLLRFCLLGCLWPHTSSAHRHKDAKKKKQQTTHQTMDAIYHNLSCCENLQEHEHKEVIAKGGYPTYGEITYQGFKTILDDIKPTKKDHFIDLGSGVGKDSMRAYLDTPMKSVKGVELSKTRHETAQKAYEQLKEKGLLHRKRKLTFLHDNILNVNLAKTTIAYTCSSYFSPKLMHGIMKKLSHLKPGLIVLTLQKLPQDYPDYGFKFVKKYTAPMTWGTETLYRYVLRKKTKY